MSGEAKCLRRASMKKVDGKIDSKEKEEEKVNYGLSKMRKQSCEHTDGNGYGSDGEDEGVRMYKGMYRLFNL